MKTFEKIPTLFRFDQSTKKFIFNNFHDRNVELLQHHHWMFTEKIDGTNFRLHWDGYGISYAGRTDAATFSKEQLAFIEARLADDNTETVIEQLFKEKRVTVYGELYGKNIQKVGSLYGPEYAIKVFDVCVDDVFLERTNMVEVCQAVGFEAVPVLLTGTIHDGIKYVLSNEKSSFSAAPLEGLVGKPLGDFRSRTGNRIMVKIKSADLKKSV